MVWIPLMVVGEVANSTETCPVKHHGEADKIPLVFVQPHTTDKTPNKITLTCHGLVMPSLQSNKIHHLFSLCLTGMVRISQKIMNCREAAAPDHRRFTNKWKWRKMGGACHWTLFDCCGANKKLIHWWQIQWCSTIVISTINNTGIWTFGDELAWDMKTACWRLAFLYSEIFVTCTFR